MTMWTWFHKLASPPHAYRISSGCAPWFGWAALMLILDGRVLGAGAGARRLPAGRCFPHRLRACADRLAVAVIYVVMAIAAAVGLIWRIKLAHAVAAACAPIGACVHVPRAGDGLDLGQADVGHVVGVGCAPDVGADAAVPVSRLHGAARVDRRPQRADRASAVLAIVGVVNVPIIQYSVDWWNTLHQPASVTQLAQALDRAVDALAAVHDAARLHALLRRRAVLVGCRARSCGASATPAGSRKR